MRRLNTLPTTKGFNQLSVVAMDNPAPGYANTHYEIEGFNTLYHPSGATANGFPVHQMNLHLFFHEDMRGDGSSPMNGVTEQTLLSILADRLGGQIHGPHSTPELQAAVQNLYEAARHLDAHEQRLYPSNQQVGYMSQPLMALS